MLERSKRACVRSLRPNGDTLYRAATLAAVLLVLVTVGLF